MSVTAVRVDAVAYRAASAVLGSDVATALTSSGWTLVDALSASGGMAGSDPTGLSWTEGYDRAAAATVAAASDAITACFRLAALLEQTGFNYGTAESASVPGGTVPSAPDRTRWEWQQCTLPAPPPAGGPGIPAPAGWSLVVDVVGWLWPDGHQDRLREAASAWRAFGAAVHAASYEVTRAYACLAVEDAPETPDALAACRSVEAQLREVAAACTVVGDACGTYADHLDEAHSAVIGELVSLVEWTVGLQAGGALLAVVTVGGSEVAAQAAEASRIAAAAARIASVLARLAALARAAATAVGTVATRVLTVGDELRPLLTSRIVVAMYEGAEPARVATSATAAADEIAAGQALAVSSGGSILDEAELSLPVSRNLRRFRDKLPAASGSTDIIRRSDGMIEFTATVPGRVAGSRAVYTKVVDAGGATRRYYKTTFTPDGRIAHVKVKYP